MSFYKMYFERNFVKIKYAKVLSMMIIPILNHLLKKHVMKANNLNFQLVGGRKFYDKREFSNTFLSQNVVEIKFIYIMLMFATNLLT